MTSAKMRDVAARAGVSVSTVSKVLGGSAAASEIPAHTIERVRQAVSDLGYIPNAVARSLRHKRTREVGVVLGKETYPASAALTLDGAFLLGLVDAVVACHLAGIVIYPREDNGLSTDVSRYLDGRIEGLLVRVSSPHQEESLLRLLSESSLPIVAIWSQDVPAGVGYVDIDHASGAYQAVQYLLDLGHRHIAYVEPAPIFEHAHFFARFQAYQQALLDAQIAPRPQWHVVGVKPEQITALFQLSEPVTAIFTPNDITAGVVEAVLCTLGMRVPEDVSLMGFDDIANAHLLAGRLTTVHQPIQEIAVQAVRNLTALIGGANVMDCRTLLPTHLVLRNSCAPPHRVNSN